MDIILHIGAHCTATTSFQDYMRRHDAQFAEQRTGFWGPKRLRTGVFSFLHEDASTTLGTKDVLVLRPPLAQQLDAARDTGLKRLIISDENVLGSVRHNVNEHRLYGAAGRRMRQLAKAAGGRITRIIISPRSLDTFWCSSLANAVARGAQLPDRSDLQAIAQDRRSWRDVITDIARAAPSADLRVLPFEHFKGRPDALLQHGADVTAPFDEQRKHLNVSPDLPALRRALADQNRPAHSLPFGMGRWNPFGNGHLAALREMHADDMMWLTAGADGLATLTEDGPRDRAGNTLPQGPKRKGQFDELEERQVARPG